jgi:hypothetical protein
MFIILLVQQMHKNNGYLYHFTKLCCVLHDLYRTITASHKPVLNKYIVSCQITTDLKAVLCIDFLIHDMYHLSTSTDSASVSTRCGRTCIHTYIFVYKTNVACVQTATESAEMHVNFTLRNCSTQQTI